MKLNLKIYTASTEIVGQIDVPDVELPHPDVTEEQLTDEQDAANLVAELRACEAARVRMREALESSEWLTITMAEGPPAFVRAAAINAFLLAEHEPNRQGVWS